MTRIENGNLTAKQPFANLLQKDDFKPEKLKIKFAGRYLIETAEDRGSCTRLVLVVEDPAGY